MLPNGTVILLYTGNSETFAQVQCLALPADPTDPLLRTWTKHPANPVIFPPPGIGDRDFRDPMAAWFDKSDNTWRTIIGSKDDHGHAGIALMYKTKDFIKYELIPDPVHRVEGTGMWECIDLYPISSGSNSSEEEIYVMKASVNDEWHDYYALGMFDAEANRWTPLDPEADVGIGMRCDWGKFYASTSFYDPVKQRRVSWGFVGETDSPNTDIAKGWASLQVYLLSIHIIVLPCVYHLSFVPFVRYACSIDISRIASWGLIISVHACIIQSISTCRPNALYIFQELNLFGALLTTPNKDIFLPSCLLKCMSCLYYLGKKHMVFFLVLDVNVHSWL